MNKVKQSSTAQDDGKEVHRDPDLNEKLQLLFTGRVVFISAELLRLRSVEI